ncbi:MAG: response regulator [Luminiphilus sp.]|jgi:CheY-like chemotaxis protein|nr:response regulator [Luminiphilus sp.]MDG1461517.1 response regulator [Luminiphilus sp.]
MTSKVIDLTAVALIRICIPLQPFHDAYETAIVHRKIKQTLFDSQFAFYAWKQINTKGDQMLHTGILIVDDESVIAEELCEFLVSFDYACQTALSADEAMTIIDGDSKISLILTDMRMPGRDGAELIQALQQIPNRQFEYLMISGHLDADEELKSINGDGVTLMRKPIDIDALLRFLDEREFVKAAT